MAIRANTAVSHEVIEDFFRRHAPIRREFRYIVLSCIKVEKARDRRLALDLNTCRRLKLGEILTRGTSERITKTRG